MRGASRYVWQTTAASRLEGLGFFSVVLSHLRAMRLKRPTASSSGLCATEMLSTIPRLTTSSRSSLWVQRVIGRPDNFGDSHATAKICATCLAVIFPGHPGRRRVGRRLRGWLHGAGAALCIPRRTATPKRLATASAILRPAAGSARLPPQSARSRAPELRAPNSTHAAQSLRRRAQPTELLQNRQLLLAHPDALPPSLALVTPLPSQSRAWEVYANFRFLETPFPCCGTSWFSVMMVAEPITKEESPGDVLIFHWYRNLQNACSR